MAEWVLRDYTVKDGQLDEWLGVWREGVLPIRRQFGFHVQAWAVPDEQRFVWALRHDGPGSYEDADRAYRTSPERAALDPEPADFIAEMRVTPIEAIATDPGGRGGMTAEWQLRDYTIQEGRFDELLAAWTAGVLPLRRRFGFAIQAWAVREASRFVWVVRYDGPGTYEERDREYYASPERAAVRPNPADFIAEQRVSWLTPILTADDEEAGR